MNDAPPDRTGVPRPEFVSPTSRVRRAEDFPARDYWDLDLGLWTLDFGLWTQWPVIGGRSRGSVASGDPGFSGRPRSPARRVGCPEEFAASARRATYAFPHDRRRKR